MYEFNKITAGMSNPLVLPKGIILNPPEEPEDAEKPVTLEELHAQIQAGYIVHETDDELFDYFIEMNVDAPMIWSIYSELVQALMPEEIAPLIGKVGESALFLCDYADKDEVLEALATYSFELTNDGFLQFGAVYQDDDLLEEVLVTPSKSFRIWTNQLETFEAVVDSMGLTQLNEIKLLEEFGRTTVTPVAEGLSSADEIVTRLTERFGIQNDFADHEEDH